MAVASNNMKDLLHIARYSSEVLVKHNIGIISFMDPMIVYYRLERHIIEYVMMREMIRSNVIDPKDKDNCTFLKTSGWGYVRSFLLAEPMSILVVWFFKDFLLALQRVELTSSRQKQRLAAASSGVRPFFWDAKHSLYRMPSFFKETSEKECQKVRESVEFASPSDILVPQLDAIGHIRI